MSSCWPAAVLASSQGYPAEDASNDRETIGSSTARSRLRSLSVRVATSVPLLGFWELIATPKSRL